MSAQTVRGGAGSSGTTRNTGTVTTSQASSAPGGPAERGSGQDRARVRAEKLAAVHAQLADAVAAAASDAGWRAWLGAAARFRGYSPTNQLLIVLQRPQACRVAGYRVWQSLGRQVRKGERGITILAPMRSRIGPDQPRDPTVPAPDKVGDSGCPTVPGQQDAQRGGTQVVGFTTVTVFDVAQTDGQALPERPVLRLPDGQAPERLWEALVAGVQSRGFTVDREDPAPAFGLTRWAVRRVQVAPDVSAAMACHVLAHELGHIAADHQGRPELARGVGRPRPTGSPTCSLTPRG